MNPVRNHAVLAAATLLFVALAAGAVSAADAPGCKDPAGLKRFEGSSLVSCEARDFVEAILPTGKLIEWDYNANKGKFASQLNLEGCGATHVYFIPKGPSSAEAYRNWRLDLDAKGYTVLWETKDLELGADQGRIFENKGGAEQLFAYSPANSRYGIAVKDEGGKKTYVSVYAIQFEGGYHSKLQPQTGQVLVRIETLEIGQLKDRMVVVTASEMERSIDATGRVTLYGILFDFNKADIKPESRPALEEIAKYLGANPARKLHVVGHTDAVGGFDFNIGLSLARANAVVTELVRSYGINAGRLKGNGVGLLAPVASNATDEGRAKNRRVELVPM